MAILNQNRCETERKDNPIKIILRDQYNGTGTTADTCKLV